MKRSFPALAALAALALSFGLTAPTGTASAMNAAGAARTAMSTEIVPAAAEQVQYRDRGHRAHRDHRWRDSRRHHRRHWDRDRRHHRHYRPRSGFYFHFGTPAPRYVPAPRRSHGISNAHRRWCHARYRSYRSWDNTFQPYHGPRRQCVSPYV